MANYKLVSQKIEQLQNVVLDHVCSVIKPGNRHHIGTSIGVRYEILGLILCDPIAGRDLPRTWKAMHSYIRHHTAEQRERYQDSGVIYALELLNLIPQRVFFGRFPLYIVESHDAILALMKFHGIKNANLINKDWHRDWEGPCVEGDWGSDGSSRGLIGHFEHLKTIEDLADQHNKYLYKIAQSPDPFVSSICYDFIDTTPDIINIKKQCRAIYDFLHYIARLPDLMVLARSSRWIFDRPVFKTEYTGALYINWLIRRQERLIPAIEGRLLQEIVRLL